MKNVVNEKRGGQANSLYRCEQDGFIGDLDAAMRHLIELHQGKWTIVAIDRLDA